MRKYLTTINWATALVFFAALLWATDAPFRVHLTTNLSSTFIVLGEHFIDVLIILPLFLMNISKLKNLKWKEWIAVILIGVGGSALGSVMFTQAFHYVNPSVAILLQKLQPLIAILLASIILREVRPKPFWPFAIMALFGAYLVSFPGLVPRLFPGEVFNPNTIGVLYALGAAVLWGASTVLGKVVLKKVDFKVMTSLRFITAFIFLLIFWKASGDTTSLHSLTGKDILFIIIIAIVSGAVSLLIYYKGLTRTKASVATFAELGSPLGAVVVNWIFLGDSLTPMQLVGMGIVLFALYQLSKKRISE